MLKQILTPLSIFALLALGCNKTANSGSASAQKSVSESDAYAAFQKNKGDGKTFGAKVTPDGAATARPTPNIAAAVIPEIE